MTECKKTYFGGQALIEGVMMNGTQNSAMASRNESGDIVYKVNRKKSIKDKYPILKVPFIRGMVAFFESMIMGFSSLSWSAMQAGEEEEKLTTKEIVITLIMAMLISILVFVIIPVVTASFTVEYLGFFGRSFVEGLIKIGLFLGYILLIRRMEDIRRVFQYHGAEHKTINAFEAGEAITVENIKKQSTLNVRCGTSFVLMSMIVMVVVFTFIGNSSVLGRIAVKIVTMPLVLGISYEVCRLPLRFPNSKLVGALVAPGMALQRLTTAEPDEKQIEVAMVSLMKIPEFPTPVGSEMPERVYTEAEYEAKLVADKEAKEKIVEETGEIVEEIENIKETSEGETNEG